MESERERIIAQFNAIESKKEQDTLLSGLIAILPVKQRRSRKPEGEEACHDFSYQYFVNTSNEGKCTRIFVYMEAFCSIFGTTRDRIRSIRKALATKGT